MKQARNFLIKRSGNCQRSLTNWKNLTVDYVLLKNILHRMSLQIFAGIYECGPDRFNTISKESNRLDFKIPVGIVIDRIYDLASFGLV